MRNFFGCLLSNKSHWQLALVIVEGLHAYMVGQLAKEYNQVLLLHAYYVFTCLAGCLMHRANQSSMHNIRHVGICGTVRTPASEDHAFHAAHCSQERVTVQPLGSPVLYWALR